MTVLILHGIGGHAGIHWQQWLHDQLIEAGQQVIMPNLSNPEHPDRTDWLHEAQGAIEGIDLDQLVVVGHSLGVPTALDLIEQLPNKIKGFVSVSGFVSPMGAELNEYFMQAKTIDMAKARPNIGRSFVLYGDDDPYVPQTTLKEVADELHVTPIVIHSGGHLNTDTGYTQFPELLQIVLSLT